MHAKPPAHRPADAAAAAHERAVDLGPLHQLLPVPAHFRAGAGAAHHPLGAERLLGRAAAARTLQPLRTQGREFADAELVQPGDGGLAPSLWTGLRLSILASGTLLPANWHPHRRNMRQGLLDPFIIEGSSSPPIKPVWPRRDTETSAKRQQAQRFLRKEGKLRSVIRPPWLRVSRHRLRVQCERRLSFLADSGGRRFASKLQLNHAIFFLRLRTGMNLKNVLRQSVDATGIRRPAILVSDTAHLKFNKPLKARSTRCANRSNILTVETNPIAGPDAYRKAVRRL